MAEQREQMLTADFAENGFENISSHDLLEWLLRSFLPLKDPKDVADHLLQRFGSLSEVFEASVSELMTVKGVSQNAAVFLSVMPQLCSVYVLDIALKETIQGMENVRNFAAKCFIGKTVEYFLMFTLDQDETLLRYDIINIGTVTSSSVNLRKMIQILLKSMAPYAVVAHNHPRGYSVPSGSDFATTSTVTQALKNINVKLLDHLIVNARGYSSMALDSEEGRQCLNIQ